MSGEDQKKKEGIGFKSGKVHLSLSAMPDASYRYSDWGEPLLKFKDLALCALEESVGNLGGYGAWFTGADLQVIDFANGRDLRCGAGEENFIG